MPRVAVLYGGAGAEREISLVSGANVLAALRRQNVDCVAIDTACGLPLWSQTEFDTAWIALHGAAGEDGSVQGALELMGRPYTGSGVLASALAMDKAAAKEIWRARGVPTPPWRLLAGDEPAGQLRSLARELACETDGALFVKPNRCGSSVATHKVGGNHKSLGEAVADAARHGEVLVERAVEGEEYTVGVLGERLLPAIRLGTSRAFYDYEAKYRSKDTSYQIPCGLDRADTERLMAVCAQAWHALGCGGWGRIDLMRGGDGEFQVLELNTIPGMTPRSLVPMAALEVGLDFDDLVLHILDLAGHRGAQPTLPAWRGPSTDIKPAAGRL